MLNLANVILMPSKPIANTSHENTWIDGVGRSGTAGLLDTSDESSKEESLDDDEL
jgi:hypothetical protein